MLFSILFSVATAASLVERTTPQTTSALVDLGYSKYQGSVLLDGTINQYLGMRYAAPPIGLSSLCPILRILFNDDLSKLEMESTSGSNCYLRGAGCHRCTCGCTSCIHANLTSKVGKYLSRIWKSISINHHVRRLSHDPRIYSSNSNTSVKTSSVVIYPRRRL